MIIIGNNKGFTLIEVLIAMAISSIVMLSIYTLFMMQIKIKRTQSQTIEVQQNIRSAMYLLERDIRMAGFAGNAVNITAGIDSGFTAATATGMTFTYVSDENAGTLTTIQYALFDDDADGRTDDLGRAVDGGAPSAIADNIEEIEFYYSTIDNAGVKAQTTIPPDPSFIKSVQISLLARSQKLTQIKTPRQYTPPSGLVIWGESGAYNDGFYRRYTTSIITCRNLVSND